jgi:hypothetical protein
MARIYTIRKSGIERLRTIQGTMNNEGMASNHLLHAAMLSNGVNLLYPTAKHTSMAIMRVEYECRKYLHPFIAPASDHHPVAADGVRIDM